MEQDNKTDMSDVKHYSDKYYYLFDNNDGKNNLIPVLKEIQLKEGYLSQNAIIAVSNNLNIPLSHVYGVVTFYNFFKLKKQGKYVISLCEGTACHVQGAPKIANVIKEKLGISAGEVSSDGKFSLEYVRCLGLCAFAPVMMINDKNFTQLAEEKVKNILDSYTNDNLNNKNE